MTKYAAEFETLEGVVRLAGNVEFTDPANQPGKGLLVPIADALGVTVDTTTYDNSVTGSGKLTTLVFPQETGMVAMAIAGDAFPRWIITADPHDAGLAMGDGTVDPYLAGAYCGGSLAPDTGLRGNAADQGSAYPHLSQVSPKFTIINTALPTQQLVSSAGAQVSVNGDVELVTPVTFNPTAGAAATCKVELSPDGVTYSTLGTETEPAGVALDGTIHLVKVRVPAGWRVKATVTNAVLGLSTYY